MSSKFYGDWCVLVAQKNAAFSQRFSISGSDNSDGYYSGTPGVIIPRVSGAEWTLSMEWNDNAGPDWHQSIIQRSPRFTDEEGFVVLLGADDNTLQARDLDFDDLVIHCRNLDSTINPPPTTYPFSFTIPEDMIKDDDNPDDNEPIG